MKERLLPKHSFVIFVVLAALAIGVNSLERAGDRVVSQKILDHNHILEVLPTGFNILTRDDQRFTFPNEFNGLRADKSDWWSVGIKKGGECAVVIVKKNGQITTIYDEGIRGTDVYTVSDDQIVYFRRELSQIAKVQYTPTTGEKVVTQIIPVPLSDIDVNPDHC